MSVRAGRADRSDKTQRAARVLVVWCPDWPVTAAGSAYDEPAAVFLANRAVAVSAAARSLGVRRGMRRREAQSRVPELVVHGFDPARDARVFEPVAAAVEGLVPRVEILRPGLLAVSVAGATRYFGGERALVACVLAAARDALDAVVAGLVGPASGQVTRVPPGSPEVSGLPVPLPPRCGLADGSFAAMHAAFSPASAPDGLIVAAGEAAGFLAPLPIAALGDDDLASLLTRLGVRTLGAYAALPADDVLARFGPEGARLHRAARGVRVRPPAGRTHRPDVAVEKHLDPPVERVEAATFAAKALAEELVVRLRGRGLACTRLRIEARTEHGEELARVWRYDDGVGGFTVAAIAERTRWQLDGWLSGTVGAGTGSASGGVARTGRPSAGVTLLRLVPAETRPVGRQLLLWGGPGDLEQEAALRAGQAIDRIAGLLGPEAVGTAVLGGGRDPRSRARLVSWGEPRGPDPRDVLPWPGRLPAPSPAGLPAGPIRVEVIDASGVPVKVSARATLSAAPATLAVGGSRPVRVVGWAGPWPVDVRWWDTTTTATTATTANTATGRARCQLVTADGHAHLAAVETGTWWLEAHY